MPSETQYNKFPSDAVTAGNEGVTGGSSQTAIQVQLGQQEVAIASLNEKIEQSRKSYLWLIGTVLTIAFGLIGGISFYNAITKDYLDSYKKLQEEYYQSKLQDSFQYNKLQICSLTSDYYWQYKTCINLK